MAFTQCYCSVYDKAVVILLKVFLLSWICCQTQDKCTTDFFFHLSLKT